VLSAHGPTLVPDGAFAARLIAARTQSRHSLQQILRCSDRILHTTETLDGDTGHPLIAGALGSANVLHFFGATKMNPTFEQSVSESSPVTKGGLSVPKLIGQVYESAPLTLRARIIEQLMRPLGVLGLMAVANGIFAGIRLRELPTYPGVGIEDATVILPSDVVALADFVQQVSREAVDGLSKLISTSPVYASSAAAVILVSVLMRRSADARSNKTV
jgi:hypothetical protein